MTEWSVALDLIGNGAYNIQIIALRDWSKCPASVGSAASQRDDHMSRLGKVGCLGLRLPWSQGRGGGGGGGVNGVHGCARGRHSMDLSTAAS